MTSNTPPPSTAPSYENIGAEILAILKAKAEAQFEYLNPNFLSEITNLIESYYGLSDDVVDSWIQEMYSA